MKKDGVKKTMCHSVEINLSPKQNALAFIIAISLMVILVLLASTVKGVI